MDIGDRLREVREGRGLSQKDLSASSGVHFNTVSGVEGKRQKPHPSTLQKLAGALDVEVEDLTGAPKGEASPSARTPAERRTSYLLGYEVLAMNTASRLEEEINSDIVDLGLVEQAARLHADLQKVAVEQLGLLQEGLPDAEAQAQQRVAAALDDLRSVVDQGYGAAITRARGQKAAVSSLGKLRKPKGGRDQERAKSA
jgi:transcriptional regulator with XRE-family HTH domain